MAPRQQLQALLEELVGPGGKVYFQPPASLQMEYPCIRYERTDVDIQHADNRPYLHKKRYQLTIITRDPDSPIPDEVGKLPTAAFDRFYTAENLNHDVYNLFF